MSQRCSSAPRAPSCGAELPSPVLAGTIAGAGPLFLVSALAVLFVRALVAILEFFLLGVCGVLSLLRLLGLTRIRGIRFAGVRVLARSAIRFLALGVLLLLGLLLALFLALLRVLRGFAAFTGIRAVGEHVERLGVVLLCHLRVADGQGLIRGAFQGEGVVHPYRAFLRPPRLILGVLRDLLQGDLEALGRGEELPGGVVSRALVVIRLPRLHDVEELGVLVPRRGGGVVRPVVGSGADEVEPDGGKEFQRDERREDHHGQGPPQEPGAAPGEFLRERGIAQLGVGSKGDRGQAHRVTSPSGVLVGTSGLREEDSAPAPVPASGSCSPRLVPRRLGTCRSRSHPDRKSTRLNSSHVAISYAVFCLKKKTQQ